MGGCPYDCDGYSRANQNDARYPASRLTKGLLPFELKQVPVGRTGNRVLVHVLKPSFNLDS